MIKHLVLWTLNPDKKDKADEIAAELGAKFRALLGVVDGLESVELGRNYNGGVYDLVLNCTFSSKEAERAYQSHPGHLAIMLVVLGLACAWTSVYY